MWFVHLGGRICPGARPAWRPFLPCQFGSPQTSGGCLLGAPSKPGASGGAGLVAWGIPRASQGWHSSDPRGVLGSQPCPGLCPHLGSILPAGILGCGGHSTSHPKGPVLAVLIRGVWAEVMGEGGTPSPILQLPLKPPNVGTQPPLPRQGAGGSLGGPWEGLWGVPGGPGCCRAGAQLSWVPAWAAAAACCGQVLFIKPREIK